MSFDVFLQAFERGEPALRELAAFEALLEPHLTVPAEDGTYAVRLRDGGEAEVFASEDADEPFTGCMFALRGVTPGLSELIFQLAQTLDLVIMPAYDGPWMLVTPEQRLHLPSVEGGLPVMLVRSAEDLDRLLKPDADRWWRYDDESEGQA